MSLITNLDQVTLLGITYDVVKVDTPESLEDDGHPRVAKMLREYGETARVYLRRPNGRKIYGARIIGPRVVLDGTSF